ncbi:MAG: nitrous oxide reductase accessory protein NosL [Deltaproteobacteria bacterium]|nr:nitrous oxide reductase accessory protein NosL [Deltaproteobacteria bacterium]
MKIKLALLIVFVLVFSCGDKPEGGPVKIYYGEDICERCKMIISEKDFAAQYQVSTGKTVKFDDLGCMFHYMDGANKAQMSAVYVMDYDSKQWVDGESAYYVWTENISTPMGHGVVALKDSREAAELSNKEKGKYLGSLKSASDWVLKDMKNNLD